MEEHPSKPKPEPEPRPLLLSDLEMIRIHKWVAQYLPPYYDRDYLADTIILNAWLKQIPHVSKEYVRHKCISAWRTLRREVSRNERASKEGRVRGSSTEDSMGSSRSQTKLSRGPVEVAERKMLVEEAVGQLSPFERRLIWMRFYDDQTQEEIAVKVKLRRDQVSKALEVAIYKMRVHLT